MGTWNQKSRIVRDYPSDCKAMFRNFVHSKTHNMFIIVTVHKDETPLEFTFYKDEAPYEEV